MIQPDVTLVLASIDSPTTVERSLHGFLDESAGRCRIIVVDSSRNGFAAEVPPGVEVISRPKGTLAPELWRDGLMVSRTPFVAFSTIQMLPRSGWLSDLLETIEAKGAAGVGGPIGAAALSPLDRAMYLLRYANYLPPVPESPSFEPPGDNAIYRRSDLDAVADSWHDGFWEIEVHKRLRAIGRTTAICPNAVVDFQGGYEFIPAVSHRLAHARRFGAGRVRNRPFSARLIRTALAPAVPPLLLSRIVRNLQTRGEPIGPWLPALPYLGLLLATWSAGEASGAMFGPRKTLAA